MSTYLTDTTTASRVLILGGRLFIELDIFSARFGRFASCGSPLSSQGRFRPRILHPALMIGDALYGLPVLLHEPDSLDWIKSTIIHPMVRLA